MGQLKRLCESDYVCIVGFPLPIRECTFITSMRSYLIWAMIMIGHHTLSRYNLTFVLWRFLHVSAAILGTSYLGNR